MKPIIYEITGPDGARNAWLVDADAVFLAPDENGKTRRHFAAAIELAELRAGSIRTDTVCERCSNDTWSFKTVLVHPLPKVLVVHSRFESKDTNTLAWRGIRPKAAVALLALAKAGNAVRHDYATDKWTFGGPAEKGVKVGWDGWKFLAAWKWSFWEEHRMSREQRRLDMAQHGYPHTAQALYQTCRRMGLVTRGKD